MALLEVDSVCLRFGETPILSGTWLSCKTGEIVGLLGLNGAGKSCLLRIIFGLLKGDSQTVRIDGEYIADAYKHRHLIAYLPQHAFLPRSLTVRKAIHLFVPSREKQARVTADERIRQLLPQKISELSEGERRYLEIHLVLALDTHFALLDEPFSAIEPLYRSRIRSLIRNYPDMKGIIVTDHDYRNILAVSHRIVLLAEGETIAIAHSDELKEWGYVPNDE